MSDIRRYRHSKANYKAPKVCQQQQQQQCECSSIIAWATGTDWLREFEMGLRQAEYVAGQYTLTTGKSQLFTGNFSFSLKDIETGAGV